MVDKLYFQEYYKNKLKNKIIKCEYCDKEVNITNKSHHLKTHDKYNEFINIINNIEPLIFKEYLIQNSKISDLKKIIKYNDENINMY